MTTTDRVAAGILGVLIVGIGFVLVPQLLALGKTRDPVRRSEAAADLSPTTAIPIVGPALVSWPMFRGSPAHTGFANVVGPRRDQLKWAVLIDAAEGQWPNSVAVSKTGTIYVASGKGLSAFDQSGTLLWEVRQPRAQGPSLSPDEQTVYFGAGTTLHAVSARDGAARWQVSTATAACSSQGSKGDIAGIITPAVSASGLIYSGTSEGIILGLDPTTRQRRWMVAAGPSPKEPGFVIDLGHFAERRFWRYEPMAAKKGRSTPPPAEAPATLNLSTSWEQGVQFKHATVVVDGPLIRETRRHFRRYLRDLMPTIGEHGSFSIDCRACPSVDAFGLLALLYARQLVMEYLGPDERPSIAITGDSVERNELFHESGFGFLSVGVTRLENGAPAIFVNDAYDGSVTINSAGNDGRWNLGKTCTRVRIKPPRNYDEIGVNLVFKFKAMCQFTNCKSAGDLELSIWPDCREPDRRFTAEEIARAIGRPVTDVEICQ